MFFSWEKFRNDLSKAVKTDFLSIYEKMLNEKIYGGCLVIDDETSSMFLVFNTLEYLSKKDSLLFGEDQFKKFREILSPEQFQASFGQYENVAMSTKWVPDKWGYGNNSLTDSLINKVNVILSRNRKSFKKNDEISIFEKRIHKVMIDALLSLKTYLKEEKKASDIFLFISITDSKKTKIIENESAKKLNSEDIYNDFIKRMDSFTDS